MAAEARPAGLPAEATGPDADALRDRITSLEQALAEARQAQGAGRTSEDRFRALFDMSRDGIIFVDLEGHIEEMNQAYLDLVGYDRDEITTYTYQDLTPEKWRDGEAEIIETQVMKRGFSDEYEKEYVRKDGSIAPVSLRTILVRDLDGRPIRFMGIVRDITEQKEAKERWSATPTTSPARTRSWSSSPTSPLTICRSRCARSAPSVPCWWRRSRRASTRKAASTSTS